MVRRLAYWLRCWADRMDPANAPRQMSQHSFTFEYGLGIKFRKDGKGCPLWYVSDSDYNRAHSESDSG